MLKVDAHQHFWLFNPVRDSWITPDMEIIRGNFMPADLQPILAQNNVDACVAVQADQSESETEFLLDLTRKNNFIAGVVGWVDLRDASLPGRLEQFRLCDSLKGFRHIVQSEPEGFLLDPLFNRGVSMLKDFAYSYDILVKPNQLKESLQFVRLHPEQPFVLDHLGKPAIKKGEMRSWAADIRQLAAQPNVYCKLSGMVTEADHSSWKKEQIFPYLDVALDEFGADRLMFGSDWPVCRLAAGYDEVCEVMDTYLAQLTAAEQQKIWAGNAIDFYKLNPESDHIFKVGTDGSWIKG